MGWGREPSSFILSENPPHRKFYEVEVELSLFYPKRLVRRWGRIGARRPRSIRRVMPDPGDLARHVEVITRLRQRHGYLTVADVRGSSVEAFAA